MVSQITVKDNKAKIFAAFGQILSERKKIDSKIATKEQEAEKEKNKQVLLVAATYTVDSIVKGLADLQLDFGTIVNGLSEKLTKETAKLDELKRAIEAQQQQWQELQQIRIVADALHLLTQEHQEKLKVLEQESARHREALEKDQAEKRKIWQKEQAEYEILVQEQTQLATKERQGEAADYQYETERLRKLEMDDYEERKRNQERELQELNQTKDKQWKEREKFLNSQQKLFTENQAKVEAFPKELEEAIKKAREEAIKETLQEAKVKADLFDKEWEASKQGYEFKIQSLEATIQKQNEQINELATQLQSAVKQAQDLAMRAFSSSANAIGSTQS